MEENKISLTKNSMNFGAITGIALFILFIVFNILGITTSTIHTILGYAIVIVGIWWGTTSYRDHVMLGSISYSRALLSGTQISFFCAVFIGFFMYLYLKFIDSSLIEKVVQANEAEMIEKGLSDEQIEMSTHYVRKFSTPGWMTFFVILGYTFFGFLFSLLIAAFVKRQDDSFDHFIEENK